MLYFFILCVELTKKEFFVEIEIFSLNLFGFARQLFEAESFLSTDMQDKQIH